MTKPFAKEAVRGVTVAIGEPAVLGSFGVGERLRVRRNRCISSVQPGMRIYLDVATLFTSRIFSLG